MDIYTKLDENSDNWIDDKDLLEKIKEGFTNFSTGKVAVRTRKKLFKEKICQILGYDIPKTFTKTKPMFPMLNFDLYIQESNNLQIWNEKIDFDRRYIIVNVNDIGEVKKIRILDGKTLSVFDTTGKLTTKLQAILNIKSITTTQYSENDTLNLQTLIKSNSLNENCLPCDEPIKNNILPINEIYTKLKIITNGNYDFEILKQIEKEEIIYIKYVQNYWDIEK